MSNQPLNSPSETVRHQIEAIKLIPTTSKHQNRLKILVNNVVKFTSPVIAENVPLVWNNIPANDAPNDAKVTIQVDREPSWYSKGSQVASINYLVSEADEWRERPI
ncbi:hypothetical protein FRC12_011600, partial [Ceratobasidium sp. 428]